jgi:hypothetical protein
MNRHAIQQNVHQKADTRCKNIIETFLRNAGFINVEISFRINP